MANEDKRIIELPASESILNDDWIGKDSASEGTTKIQLSLLKQLFGGNNFAGEWHSGTVYNKEAYVTHEGKLYHNIKGGSVVAVDWSSSQWEQVSIGNELRKIVESLAPTFDTSTNYKVDDLVIYDNTLYRCIAAHTAGTWVGSHFGTVKVSSLLLYAIMDIFTEIYWEDYSGSPVNYTKGTVIHKGLKLYRCKANTTNQSWDSSKWEQVDVTDLINSVTVLAETLLSNIAPTFSSLAQYSINDFVIYNNQLYICMKPHHGSWDPLDFGTGKIGDILKGIFNNIADVYNPSNSYVKGDVVNYLGMPLKCIVDTATSPMVFSEWERVTFEQLIDEKVSDVQIAGQTTVDENKISDLTSLAIEGTASGEIASFSDGSNLPMKSFVCDIDAVQDLHGYDGPWVGGGGVNKIDTDRPQSEIPSPTTYSPEQCTVEKTGTTFKSTATGAWSKIKFGITGLKENQVYTLSALFSNPSATKIGLAYLSDTWHASPISLATSVRLQFTFTYTSDITLIAILVNNKATSDDEVVTVSEIQLEEGSTVSAYKPYSNICPISGHTGVHAFVRGKNVIDILGRTIDSKVGSNSITPENATLTKDGEKIIAVINGPWSKVILQLDANRDLVDGKTYTFSAYFDNPNNNTIGMGFRYSTTSSWTSVVSTTTSSAIRLSGQFTHNSSNGRFLLLACFINNTASTVGSTVTVSNIQVEPNPTATTYEPYNPNSQTIQVSWQTEAGEVFGGYVDLVSGVLTVDKAGVDMGTLTWIKDSSANNSRYVAQRSGIKSNSTIISDIFKPATYSEVYYHRVDEAIATHDTYAQVVIHSSTFEAEYDADGFKTQMSGHYAVYELATSQTYQLTPTQIKSLLGNNNAWCSTGDVNVKFNKDATTVINSLIARIEALENA